MAQTGSITAQKLVELLTATDSGLGPAVDNLATEAGIDLPAIPPQNVIGQNVPVALMEKSTAVKYPVVHVYCDRAQNLLTEKFRTFSGKVRTVAEVRMSQDRI